MASELYTSGEYLKRNPTWHVEESPWKAQHVLRMLSRNALTPNTICEVGCGVGEVLKQLQEHLAPTCELQGYDISPQAIVSLPNPEKMPNFTLPWEISRGNVLTSST